MELQNKYSLFQIVPTKLGDPITSLKLSTKYAFIGTMSGKVFVCLLNNKKIQLVVGENNEEISGFSFHETQNVLLASVGDELISKYNIQEGENGLTFTDEHTKIYNSDFDHTSNCENAYIILSNDSLLRIQINQAKEYEYKINQNDEVDYEIKYFNPKENFSTSSITSEKGKITLTNYSIPFDFDGNKFVWVEYLEPEKRNLRVNYLSKSSPFQNFKYDLKDFGRINHCKLLKDNEIFLVHSLNKCEIRKLDQNFTKLQGFTHLGDEVYAVDVFYHSNQETSTLIDFCDKNYNNYNYNDDGNERRTQIYNRDYFLQAKSQEFSKTRKENDLCDKKVSIEEGKYNYKRRLPPIDSVTRTDNLLIRIRNSNGNNMICSIVTLDIDGNVNLFELGEESKLFNLFDIKEIPQSHKDKQLFALGYAYYIKASQNFFCISSDFGCYIIKKN